MPPNLAASRAVRAQLAAGTPPPGWPTIESVLSDAPAGMPIPKCTMLDCPNPGIYHVRMVALTSVSCSTSTYACHEHLDHIAVGGADWVRQP